MNLTKKYRVHVKSHVGLTRNEVDGLRSIIERKAG